MQLILISPTNTQRFEINWLEVHTPQGSFVVQEGHAPMIAQLQDNKKISFGLDDGTTQHMLIAGGIIQIQRHEVTLLITHE